MRGQEQRAAAPFNSHSQVPLENQSARRVEAVERFVENLGGIGCLGILEPDDLEAREGMSLASLYGGLCLGPVNTAAVHALAYPLGGEFHVPHGLSNALLLSHVFRFNAQATPDRHAAVAIAMGVRPSADALDTAYLGADRLKQLATDCGVLTDLSRYKVDLSAIPGMAKSAMTVTRLLKNNPRDIDEAACLKIYSECFQEQ